MSPTHRGSATRTAHRATRAATVPTATGTTATVTTATVTTGTGAARNGPARTRSGPTGTGTARTTTTRVGGRAWTNASSTRSSNFSRSATSTAARVALAVDDLSWRAVESLLAWVARAKRSCGRLHSVDLSVVEPPMRGRRMRQMTMLAAARTCPGLSMFCNRCEVSPCSWSALNASRKLLRESGS